MSQLLPAELAARVVLRSLETPLNAREQEILEHLAQGLTNPEIARRLQLSRKTVSKYVSLVLEKLDAHTRTEAVATAIRRGIVRTG